MSKALELHLNWQRHFPNANHVAKTWVRHVFQQKTNGGSMRTQFAGPSDGTRDQPNVGVAGMERLLAGKPPDGKTPFQTGWKHEIWCHYLDEFPCYSFSIPLLAIPTRQQHFACLTTQEFWATACGFEHVSNQIPGVSLRLGFCWSKGLRMQDGVFTVWNGPRCFGIRSNCEKTW